MRDSLMDFPAEGAAAEFIADTRARGASVCQRLDGGRATDHASARQTPLARSCSAIEPQRSLKGAPSYFQYQMILFISPCVCFLLHTRVVSSLGWYQYGSPGPGSRTML